MLRFQIKTVKILNAIICVIGNSSILKAKKENDHEEIIRSFIDNGYGYYDSIIYNESGKGSK